MMPDVVGQLILEFSNIKHAILVPAALVFGTPVSLVAGFFVQLGYLKILPTVAALMAGEFLGDLLWYAIGYKYGERFIGCCGHYVGITQHHVEGVKALFDEHDTNILFFSKVSLGFGLLIVVLFTAGMVRVPLRRFIAISVLGQVVWTSVLLTVGLVMAHFYSQVTSVFEKALAVVTATVVIVGFLLLRRYLKKRMKMLEKAGAPSTN